MASIQCHIVSAEEELFAGDVELIVAAGQLGDIGITASHAPLLTVLQPGSVKLVMKDSDDVFFYVSGGF
ncbi:MAG: F0F1 ATP synthase subunit epsilon, partial [Pseudomonadota bacterium]